ncbi:MAG: hypothetical protein WC947_01835 [Elusimicrobiota bacterium]
MIGIFRNDLRVSKPLSSPTSSSLLQFLYGSWERRVTFLRSRFFSDGYRLSCLVNSGRKYVL